MKKQFKDIGNLIIKDTIDPSLHLNKLAEEFGELAQAINKTTGRKSKKKNETVRDILENIKEELCDNIQILFALANIYKFSYEDLIAEIEKKNSSYKSYVNKKKK